jgi:uncharacterized protein YuzE
MKITYDPEVDAMNIKFQSGKYNISKEIADGIIVDYTKDGRVISIEILDASKKIPMRSIKDITVALPVEAFTGAAVANVSD